MADIQELIQLEFIEIGEWGLDGESLKIVNFNNYKPLLEHKNILYAFVSEKEISEVVYIGKTTKGAGVRLAQYKTGSGQATNNRIHQNIKDLIKNGFKVKILILVDLQPLQWGGFNLNVAAGLEDDLILKLRPEWNNTHGLAKTTLAELEDSLPVNNNQYFGSENFDLNRVIGFFNWKLGQTYYNTGYMNPGVSVDDCFGKAGEIVELQFENGPSFTSLINRSANRNGTVRLHFNESVKYLKENFPFNASLEILIQDVNKLLVLEKRGL